MAYTSTVQDEWTNNYAGSRLDLSGYVLNFEDNFNAMSVVPSDGDGVWYAPVRAPYGAAKFMGPDATVSPFSVSDGALTIEMEQVNGAWQSGHMQTANAKNEGYAQTYGYFEMRAKFDGGIGAWTGLWLLPADPSKPRVEIDIIEAYGGDGHGHHAAVHFTPTADTPFQQKIGKSDYTGLKADMFDGKFHTYGGLVTPDWIIIYFDGAEVTRFKSNEYVNVPMFMNVSLAMTEQGVGRASGDYSTTVDYVRAYADPNLTALVLRDRPVAEEVTGTRFNDTIYGSAGDILIGGAGDDSYRLADPSVRIVESAGAGVDTVIAGFNLVAPENVENVRLEGAANASVIGNELGNLLVGNAGDNVLDGRGGADTLQGGAGSDTYYVDSSADVVVDGADSGVDLVISSVSFSLGGTRIENLTLTGFADVNGRGNDEKNYLVGNAGRNVLDGGARDDTMAGGAGDDTYYVGDMADKVIEENQPGVDLVIATQSFSLGKAGYTENLTLAGAAPITGTGNELNNVLVGNGAGNVLDGKAGADTIAGGGGSDTLIGGAGADHFLFDGALAQAGLDLIKDFSVVDDTIDLSRAAFAGLGGAAALSPDAFRVGTAAGDASDRIIYDAKTGDLFYDADGQGGVAQVKFAQLSAGLALSWQDFLVV